MPEHAAIFGSCQRMKPIKTFVNPVQILLFRWLALVLPNQNALSTGKESIGLLFMNDGLKLFRNHDARRGIEGFA